MLDRSTIRKEALIHSIPIGEVKDMKSDVLWALNTFLSKTLWSSMFFSSISTIFKKEILCWKLIAFYNIFTIEIGIFEIQNLLAI
jgi:hypothetical protein